MSRVWRVLVGVAFAAALAMGAPLAAVALTHPGAPESAVHITQAVATDVDDFSFASFEADYYLSRDTDGHSRLRTVETFVAIFPDIDQNRGFIRAIPNDYDRVPLNTAVESVVDETGAAVPYEISVVDGFTEVALGTDEFVRGAHSYVITYTQENVVRAFADTGADEFYWDTNGTGFNQAFGVVTARVHVDAAISPFLNGDAACYYGAQGSPSACAITLPDGVSADDSTADPPTQGPEESLFEAAALMLQPGQNLSVAIGFEPGTFDQVQAQPLPDEPLSGWPFEQRVVPLVVRIMASGAMIIAGVGALSSVVRRLLRPKDARGRGVIIPQYTVPRDMSPMLAADIVDRTRTALSAQLVSLAVRGKLRILDAPAGGQGERFAIELRSAANVANEEHELLIVLFGLALEPGTVREVSRTDAAQTKRLNQLPRKARNLAIGRGWRTLRPDRVGSGILRVQIVVFVVAALLFIGGGLIPFVSSPMLHGPAFILVFVTFFVSIVALIISMGARSLKAPLTEAGVERRDYLRGMRMYLQLAEEERFRMLQSPDGAERATVPGSGPGSVQMVKLYEKLLPYAVLWGVEKEWTRELGRYYDQGAPAPDWFVSSRGFDAHLFSRTITVVAASTRLAKSSAVSSSGFTWSGGSSGGSYSGGSRGGGFSGGGGGGGGGRGR